MCHFVIETFEMLMKGCAKFDSLVKNIEGTWLYQSLLFCRVVVLEANVASRPKFSASASSSCNAGLVLTKVVLVA